jgi:hypothetical protein
MNGLDFVYRGSSTVPVYHLVTGNVSTPPVAAVTHRVLVSYSYELPASALAYLRGAVGAPGSFGGLQLLMDGSGYSLSRRLASRMPERA